MCVKKLKKDEKEEKEKDQQKGRLAEESIMEQRQYETPASSRKG